MKKIFAALALASLCACATETEYGDCIGVLEIRNPALRYEVSVRNIVVGAVFFEMVFPPVYVILSALQCPQGAKE